MNYGGKAYDDLLIERNYLHDRVRELKEEIIGLKRVQSWQGSALNKLEFRNDYPQKIKGLTDDLKIAKDKIKLRDDELTRQKKLLQQV